MHWRRGTAAAAVFAVVLGSAQAFKGSTSIRHVRAAPTVVCSLQPQAVSRRHAGLLGGALLLSPPSAWAARAAKKSAGGKWAQHYDEFTPDELEGFTETASGLQYKDIAEGDGAMPAKGQGVYAHYSGYLLESGNLFDSSYERGKPLQFAVGTGRVIKGWDEALLTMRVGGRRMLVIPAELGYGAKGIGPIPPNADLVFYVELA